MVRRHPVVSLLLVGAAVAWPLAMVQAKPDKQLAKSRDKCAGYGFEPGTDAYANCVMKLSQANERRNPDRETLLRRYRDLSMQRRGDDRYPVCGAAMMDNELDISTGKWVGPDCQMAPE